MIEDTKKKLDDCRGVLHDVRNLVMILEASFGLLEGQLADNKAIDGARELLKVSRVSIERIKRVLRNGGEEKTVVDVKQMLFDVVDYYKDGKTVLHADFSDGGVMLNIKYSDLLRVVQNVVKNAFEAMEGLSDKRLRVTVRDYEDTTVIKIFNSGPSIPEIPEGSGLVDYVFLDGTSSKDYGDGIGLYTTKALVEANGGKVSVENIGCGGVEFTLTFPKGRQANARELPASTS